MRVYWRNNVKDLSLLYRDYFVLGDLQGMVFRHKTLHFTAELIGQENIREICSNRKLDSPDYFQ